MSTALSPAQRAFLDLLVARAALKFGDFTLKSGRRSPYFINTGCFHQGGDLARLGRAYADAMRRHLGDGVQVVFGPAYKGIPLALAAAQGYEELVGRPVGWAFDRKEAKDHGDGGSFVGAPLKEGTKVAVVDDVITAGTAVRETMAKLVPLKLDVLGVVVAVDREEPGPAGVSAIGELRAAFGIPVVAGITITEAADALAADGRMDAAQRAAISAYLER
jgi:orotate phosphoribosyltransferase